MPTNTSIARIRARVIITCPNCQSDNQQRQPQFRDYVVGDHFVCWCCEVTVQVMELPPKYGANIPNGLHGCPFYMM